jgi:beta-lactam-binding protein with PASTA domain
VINRLLVVLAVVSAVLVVSSVAQARPERASTASAPSEVSTHSGGATAAKVRVPSVIGMRMDRATRLLHSKALRVNEECDGLFGCIDKRNWVICTQTPRPGKLVREFSKITIFGARSMGDC